MELLPHQKKASKAIQKKLNKHNICLFVGEVRSGKSLSFIDAVYDKKALIITTVKAMKDLKNIIPDNFDIINYHSCQKLHHNDYEVIILDECHNYITGYPKRSAIWTNVQIHTKGKPIIFSTGTPTPEGYAGLFNMFATSSFSTWNRYKRFTLWHEDYGMPYTMRINNITITKYDRTIVKKVKKDIKKYTVKIAQEEAGHKFFAKDKIHDIELSKKQSKIIKVIEKDLVYEKGKYVILADTPAKLMQKKHQISGGFCKCEDEKLMTFKNNPKVDYINKTFDPNNTIILAYFVAEQRMLEKIYPNVGSVISNAEGVDYSHFENMVIFSFGYSAKNYEQVRARQMNMFKRKTEINVHFLMTNIDQKIYNAVSQKKNFTASWFRK
jgi:hypothetical protein